MSERKVQTQAEIKVNGDRAASDIWTLCERKMNNLVRRELSLHYALLEPGKKTNKNMYILLSA